MKEEKKINKPKKNKNKHMRELIFKVLGIIVLFTIILIFALKAPIFNITTIEVEGNENVSSEMIIDLSNIKKGDNIFKYGNATIKSIKENTYIDSVSIKRKMPNTVLIKVTERKVKYQINLINSYTYIDKNGYILENSTVKREIPSIVGLSVTENELINKKRLENQDLEKLNNINKIIETAKNININDLITEINVENNKDYVLYLESKLKKIHIGDTTNLTNKMLYVQKILENEEGKTGTAFVNGDINSGFKPYFREE